MLELDAGAELDVDVGYGRRGSGHRLQRRDTTGY